MKKVIFMILGLAGCFIAEAQTKGSIEFGFNTGLNLSDLYSRDAYYNTGTNVSFNIGGSAEYYFSDRWGIKTKVIYDKKGWDDDVIFDDESGDLFNTDINLDYITIPVMANWHFGAKRNWYINFGPYVGILMSAKETAFDTDVKDVFNTTDIGLVAGIGVKIPVTQYLKVFIELEQQGGGFNDLFRDSNGHFANSRNAINVGVNFLL